MPDGGAALTWWYLLAAAAGYLLGSIPFGLVLTRAAGLGDIRRLGSGNIGATNVLRTGSKALAAATLLLDGGKGAVAALALAPWDAGLGLVAGFAAVIGHNFPVWLRFRGGKGVATTLGVLLAVAWPVGLLACLTWLVVAAVFRYSSLAALVAIFIYVPTEKTEGVVQRIMYFHVPSAWIAFFAFFIVFLCSILFLWKKERVGERLQLFKRSLSTVFG